MSSVYEVSKELELGVLLDEFKKGLPERIAVHLDEQKVETLAVAAEFTDASLTVLHCYLFLW